jgi:glutamyl-Q tRNA(Asp) synthetase
LVAALASYLDAKAHGGRWLVRMEDVDTPRCIAGADHIILQQLSACGMHPDAPPVWQSQRAALYQEALGILVDKNLAYPCACSRKDIEVALQGRANAKPRHGELIYPGTCRSGLHGKTGRAWRMRTDVHPELHLEQYTSNMPLALMDKAQAATKKIASSNPTVHWTDRRLGPQQHDVAQQVGDFVLQRADGLFSYQLAVVVDDAAQGVTHVVRGEDLADNTARQILLQRALDLPTPQYLHTPLVRAPNGEKLSKQNGAQPIDTSTPQAAWRALAQAADVLGLMPEAGSLAQAPDPASALLRWAGVWREALDRAVSGLH